MSDKRIMGPKNKKGKKESPSSAEDSEKLKEEELLQQQRDEELARQLEAKKKAAELYIKELEWQKFREVQAPETLALWNEIQDQATIENEEYRQLLWWDKFVQHPTGRPDPMIPKDVFTYISLWKNTTESLAAVVDNNLEALELLKDIELSKELYCDSSEFVKYSWLEQITLFENIINDSLRRMTFSILLNAQNYTNLQTGNLEFFAHEKNVTLCLWSSFTKNLKNRTFENEEFQLCIEVPVTLVMMGCAVQLRHTTYDHFSHYCETFASGCPPHIEEPESDILLKSSQDDEITESMQKDGISPTVTATAIPSTTLTTGASSSVKMKVTDESGDKLTDSRSRKSSYQESEAETGELDLHEMVVLGGIWYVELLELPPQPTKVAHWRILESTSRWIAPVLKNLDYEFDFVPPISEEELLASKKDSEEMEAELARTQQEMEKLLFVTICLPPKIIWMENQRQPIVAFWDEARKFWTMQNLYETKFDEEKRVFTFRMLKFGPVALLQNKYTALPYQSWSVLPLNYDSVKIIVQSGTIQAEFKIMKHECVMTTFIYNEEEALQDLCNKPMSSGVLFKELQECGINFSPDHDAHKYMKHDVKIKDWNLEDAMYKNIAIVCKVAEVASSRWNITVGSKKATCRLREVISEKIKGPYHVVLCTLRRVVVIKVMDTGQEFNEDEVPGQEFAMDLYHLMLMAGSEEAKENLRQKFNAALCNNVYRFLCCLKPLSYCG